MGPMSTETLSVLVTDEIHPDGIAALRERPGLEIDVVPILPAPELLERIPHYHALIGRSATRIPAELLERGRRLRIIGRAGVGVDNIDVDRATELGIAVINAPGGNTVSVVELTFGLLLALARRVHAAAGSMTAGRWDRSVLGGVELRGRTLAVVGLGRIGGEMARRAGVFGMRVLAVDPYIPETRFRELGVERVETLEDALRRADVLSLHIPLTRETRGMIGSREVALLGGKGLLLNLSRGGIVDESALLSALEEGRIAGAGIDVYEREPLDANHPLRHAPNVLLTPHLGASTREAQTSVAVEACAAVRDALMTGDLSAALNAVGVGGPGWGTLQPAVHLAERLGRLGRALATDGIREMELRYAGPREDAPRPLMLAALQGALRGVIDRRAINLVNALHVAAERDIETTWARVAPRGEVGDEVELRLRSGGTEIRLGGTLFGEARGRITRINGFHVDVVPRGTLVVLRNRDVPGVIGRVGTLLGEAGVNIAEYHQARMEAGGEALAAVSIDSRLSDDLLRALAALPEVRDIRQVGMS